MKYSFCFILIVLLGCHNVEKNVSGYNVDADMDTSNSSIDDVFSHVSVIPLETQDNCLISSVKKLICDSLNIYVFDQKSQQIYLFDSIGNFKMKLDKMGEGPDSYNALEDFDVDVEKNNISVLSSYGQYKVYNYQGDLLSSARIPYQAVHYFSSLSTDLTALYTYINDGRLLIYSLSKNEIVKEYVMSKNFVTLKTPYNSIQSPFRKYNDKLYFIASDKKKIYHVLENGEIEVVYSFKFGENDYDVNELPNDQSNSFYINENRSLEKIYCLSDFAEVSNWYMLYYMYKHSLNTLFISKDSMTKRVLYNKKNRIRIYYPFFVDNTGVYSIVMVSDAKQIIKHDWLSKDEWNLINCLSSDANPIVIKYHFKK